jgi:hypothetical protein
MNIGIVSESLGQGMGSRLENPRSPYEALSAMERPSTLERGSSTTKRSQAVSTRVYQSDLPSVIAAHTLTQGLAVWIILNAEYRICGTNS